MVGLTDMKGPTSMAVSVCIPTYKRHDLLRHCLGTVLASTVRPLEIVVSDDAHEPELEALLHDLALPADVTLRYAPNRRGRRQAANVQNAFEHASHEIVVLMHDDDFFLPGGLDALWRAWQAADDGVDAVYGRQRVVDAAGTELPERTERWNRQFRRLEPGVVPSRLWAALMQQFPMNGMMLRRSVALAAGVPPEHEVGHHSDLHFGIRYAQTATRPYRLIDDHVSAYRWSAQSIRRSGGVYELDGHLDYTALEAIEPVDDLERAAVDHALDVASSWAVLAFVAQRDERKARAVFWRHFRRMHTPWASKLKLAVVIAGTIIGIRWPEDRLRRRHLGFANPLRRHGLGRAS